MTNEKLFNKLKLWMILHGVNNLSEFSLAEKKIDCNSVKCKYAHITGYCNNPIERRTNKTVVDEDGPICITWLLEE